MGTLGVSTLLTVTLEGEAAEGEEGLEITSSADLELSGWTGGGGARYFTLVG